MTLQKAFDPPSARTLSDVTAMIEELSPMPKCSSIRSRKRKAEASVVVTSSPYKNALAAKQQKMGKQPKPKPNRKPKPKPRTCAVSKKKCREDRRKRCLKLPAAPKVVKPSDVYCIFCDELYVDPPSEDWTQCPKCHHWYHELCGDIDLAHCGQC